MIKRLVFILVFTKNPATEMSPRPPWPWHPWLETEAQRSGRCQAFQAAKDHGLLRHFARGRGLRLAARSSVRDCPTGARCALGEYQRKSLGSIYRKQRGSKDGFKMIMMIQTSQLKLLDLIIRKWGVGLTTKVIKPTMSCGRMEV